MDLFKNDPRLREIEAVGERSLSHIEAAEANYQKLQNTVRYLLRQLEIMKPNSNLQVQDR